MSSDKAFEIEGGLIIDGLLGIFYGTEPPSYSATNSTLHITPTGLYQRVNNAWVGGYPIGTPAPKQVAGATLENVGDGEFVFDMLHGQIVYRRGNVLEKFSPDATINIPTQLDYSKPRNSFFTGVL